MARQKLHSPIAPGPAAAAADPKGEASTRVLRQFRVVFNAVKTHFQQVEKKAAEIEAAQAAAAE